MRYFLNDNGGWMSVSGDADVFAVVPAGYREVTEEEFNAAAGTIILPLPQESPVKEDVATAAPAKATRAKAR